MIRRAMLVLTTMAITLLLASGAALAGADPKTNAPEDARIQSQSASDSTSERASTEGVNEPVNGSPSGPPPTSTKNGFTLTMILGEPPEVPEDPPEDPEDPPEVPEPPAVGDELTFTITETNNTAVDYYFGAGITDILPRAVTFSEVEGPPDALCTNTKKKIKNKKRRYEVVNCKGFTIPAGETVTMTITVMTKKAGIFRNKANDTTFPGNEVSVPFTVIPVEVPE